LLNNSPTMLGGHIVVYLKIHMRKENETNKRKESS